MPTFDDGFGHRVPLGGEPGEALESLQLCEGLAGAPSTEAALSDRLTRLAHFSHPSFGAVRRVERLRGETQGLIVVSEAVAGVRLSEALSRAEARGVPPDASAALSLLQQVVSAVAALHQHARDAAHGAIGPERIVVRADGSVAVMEYVLAAALEPLRLSRGELWERFRVPVPSTAGSSRFDQVTDVLQLGMLAVSLIVGRLLRVEDIQPHRMPDLLETATAGVSGEGRGFPRPLRAWVAQALLFESRLAFRSAPEMERALAAAIAEDGTCEPSIAAVRAYLARCAGDCFEAQGGEAPSNGAAQVVEAAKPASGPVRVRPSRVLPAEPAKSGPQAVRVAAKPPSGVTPAARAVPGGIERLLRPSSARWTSRARHFRRSLARAAQVAGIAASLMLIWGATFLGARSYLGFPSLLDRSGTLVVESRPAGVELLVNGTPPGRTPATLRLRAGAYTLALRTAKGTTLVPVTVVAGGHQVERVEIRSGARKPKRTSVRQPER